jgi:hypothetical protein
MATDTAKLSDADLLLEWNETGARLLALNPAEFQQRFRDAAKAFRNSLEPNIVNWSRLASSLLSREPRMRILLAKLAVAFRMRCDELARTPGGYVPKIRAEDAIHVGYWTAKGPKFEFVMVLLKHDEIGFVLSFSIHWPAPRKPDGNFAPIGKLSEDEALAYVDRRFQQIMSGTTQLGTGFTEAQRIIVNGTRAEMVAALRARNLDDRSLN